MIEKIINYIIRLLFKPTVAKNAIVEVKYFKKPKRKVSKVFIHCSASDREEDQSLERLKFLHTFNKGHKTTWGRYGKIDCEGWKYIGYHFYITKDAVIHKCRPLEIIPSSQAPFNTGSISICLAGEYEFTKIQMQALVDLCTEIHLAYDRITFWGHREVDKTKICPVFPYRQVLNLDDNGIMGIV